MKREKRKTSSLNRIALLINKWTLFISSLTLAATSISLILMINFNKKEREIERGLFKIISVTAVYNYDLFGRKPKEGEAPQCPSIEVWIQNQSRLDQTFNYFWFVLESKGKLITKDGISMRLFVPRFSKNLAWVTDCERLKILFDENLSKLIFENQYKVEAIVTGDELKRLILDLKRKYDRFDRDIKNYYNYFPIKEN